MDAKNQKSRPGVNRRDFIIKSTFVGTGIALGLVFLTAFQNSRESRGTSHHTPDGSKVLGSGKRKLGSLEVSEIGLAA